MSTLNGNIYDVALISKIKESTGSKKLKKINRNLRNLIEEDTKEFSGLKIKKFEEKKEEGNVAPIIEIRHYIEDYKKSNSPILDSNDEFERENTPATIDDNEILKKLNFSFSSADD